MSDATTTLPDRLAPRTDHAATALSGLARGLPSLPVRLARFLGFWTAVAVPFTYLPLLAFGLPGTGAGVETFVGLLAANCVGLVLGRNYGRDAANASPVRHDASRTDDAETGTGDAETGDDATDVDAVETGTDAVDATGDARYASDVTDVTGVDADDAHTRASEPGEDGSTGPGTPASPGDPSSEAPATGAAD